MSKKMPVAFIGHGSPMNAIADNDYTRALNSFGKQLPRPKAVLCVSAHWMSEGSWVTHMKSPRTIHDFYGFPQALFDVQYPAPSDPALAEAMQAQIKDPPIQLDSEMWGFDHGTWSVLRHVYPEADVPVLQLSIYMEQPPSYHFKLGQQLRALREQGVLIVGSGNLVHNLRKIDWDENAKPHDWAVEIDEWIKQKLEKRDFKAIVDEALGTAAGKLSHPTPDHWYPFLYVLGAADDGDELSYLYEGLQNASISMRSVILGRV
jgi:4,5-DOPA dioxygenase extradiol